MRRQLLLMAGALAVLALLSLACDGGREEYEPETAGEDQYLSAVPPGSELIEVAMGDFCFYPDPLHLPAGQTVTLKVTNLGNVRHELMGGRELGGHGYEQDFFAGLEDLQLTGDPRGYTWEVESEGEDAHGGADEPVAEPAGEGSEGDGHGHGEAPPNDWTAEGEVWNCDEQVLENAPAHAPGVDFDAYAHEEMMPGAEDEDMPGMDGAEENRAGMEEDGSHMEGESGGSTYELNLDAFATIYMTFTVPEDYTGEWEIGCFIPRHYERGMGGKIVVE
jgi:uncharacterized cupredoxin-like copper-binding protein